VTNRAHIAAKNSARRLLGPAIALFQKHVPILKPPPAVGGTNHEAMVVRELSRTNRAGLPRSV